MEKAMAVVSHPRELGVLLKQARRHRQFTQEQVARELGISQAYVSELETGKDSLALTRVFDFMRLTGLTMRIEHHENERDPQLELDINQESLLELCMRYGLAELAVFGSVARGGARADSDVDLLYTLKPGIQIGWAINDLNDELEVLIGRRVDLVSKKNLHPSLRDEVLNTAKVIYAA